ncbi:MAG TPA: 50S ribosomal protein L6 [Candidatus Paceibacterota bacterium]|nr:50S ribosomal protein L6 [Candidatus Paceibacterota bacterium]
MSRSGKLAIKIPAGTSVALENGGISVKGKGGTLTRAVHPAVSISIDGGEVKVLPAMDTRLARALWGTYAAHVRSMIAGVNTPFSKKLDVQGIGYRAELSGKAIKLNVGFSHPIFVEIPEGISVTIEKNIITISGIDKDAVGLFTAKVRAIKKPEPYKGKGIRYEKEIVRHKDGKKSGASA